MQHAGQRLHAPLPYRFEAVAGLTSERRLRLELRNPGPVGVEFTVHDNLDQEEPWHFTIGAGDSHAADDWSPGRSAEGYDLTLRGPNGYWRRYAGSFAATHEATLVEHADKRAIELRFANAGTAPVTFQAAMDDAYPVAKDRLRKTTVAPGKTVSIAVPLDASDDWYDLTVTAEGNAGFLRRFAGKVETGEMGKTDPGIGTMRVTA